MRVAVVAAAIGLSVVGLSAADDSKAAIRKDTSIPAQGLAPALQTLAKTYDFQVLYRTEVVGDLRTQGAVGTLTAPEALKQVLSGTGLSFKYLDENTVTILPASAGSSQEQSAAPSPTSQEAAKEGKKSSSGPFRVAQVDQGQTSGPSTVEKQDDQASKRRPVQLEEVVVTGSRIPTISGQGPQEVQLYDRLQIEKSGQTTVSDFLNTLPDVSTSITEAGFQTSLGATAVVLHGLPIGTTLVLINGRRTEVSGSQGSYNIFDLNNIPLAAVERIEVLSEGSSAVYGADAIGGVVNILLKKDFDGFSADVKYGEASAVDDWNASLTWGMHWDRASLSLVGSAQKRSELEGFERSIAATQDFTRFGGRDARSLDCDPGNVFSINGSNLPGVGAPYAAVPSGFTGQPSQQEFANTAGMLNKCSPNAYVSLIPETQRTGALLNGSFSVTPSIELFTEMMFSHVDERPQFPPPQFFGVPGFQSFTVSASNPFNPFGQTVGISDLLLGVGRTQQPEVTTFFRPLVGARGTFFDSWYWEVAGWASLDWSTNVQTNNPNFTAVQAALNSSVPSTALNPFVQGAQGSPQLLQSLVYDQRVKYASRTKVANGFVRGPLIQLPSGPLELVLGSEYDRDSLYFNQLPSTGAPAGNSATYDRTRSALFGEARLPIVANRKYPKDGDTLAMTVAGRYDHYDDFGSKATPQIGAEWRPTSTLLVRGTYGEAFKAPNLSALYTPPVSFQLPVTDPSNGNQLEVVNATFGGNPHLRPETGRSSTIGVFYASKEIPGLQLSVTHWKVEEGDSVQSLQPQVIVDNASLFPGAVVRNSAGVITQVNATYLNFGQIKVAGLDYQANYKFDTALGEIAPSLRVTQTYKYSSALTPGSAPTDRTSMANDDGNWAPRLKGTAALNWALGPYSVSLDGRYVGRYRDYDPLPNGTFQQLGNFWILDANFRLKAGDAFGKGTAWLKGTYIELGGVNLFDQLPQFSNIFRGYNGYDFTQADLRGRFLYVHAGVKW
jgi:iron complex outermembrane receptor protein